MENVLIFQEMLDFSTPGSFKLPKRTFLHMLFSTVQNGTLNKWCTTLFNYINYVCLLQNSVIIESKNDADGTLRAGDIHPYA